MSESDRWHNNVHPDGSWVHSNTDRSTERSPERTATDVTRSEITNFIGKAIRLPAGWDRLEHSLGGHRVLLEFKSPTDDAKLSLYYRGMGVNDRAAHYLLKLLEDNTVVKTPQVLLPEQIRNLSDVMGKSNAGDNQFTNAHSYPDPQAPAFHLSSAQLISVNNRTVLEVQGDFVNDLGKPQNFYRGIFINTGGDGKVIREFFLQAPTQQALDLNYPTYRQTLRSIQW